MANTTATPTWVVKESARYFVNSLKGVANFRRTYDDQYIQAGAKVGNLVKIRLPQQWTVRSGQGFDQQNILDQTVELPLNRQRGIDFGFSSQEATTELDMVRERYVQPAAETLANQADSDAMEIVYKDVYNFRGLPGTTTSASLTWLQLNSDLTDGATPDTGRVAVLDPLAEVTLVNADRTMQHPGPAVSENWRRGQFAAMQLGVDSWFHDQNVPKHTTGACTGASTPLINGASQTGSSIVTDGWGSGTSSLKEGDIVQFAGVYQVNPVSKISTGRLMKFTLTADISDTAGAITMSISPSIVTSGQLQNVTSAPADNAVVTYWAMAAGGTQAAVVSPQSLLFHPDAFAFVMADMARPQGGADAAFVQSKQMGISIRYVEQFQILSDQNLKRLDILYGAATIQARLAGRMVG
jgi:hypothetical protein